MQQVLIRFCRFMLDGANCLVHALAIWLFLGALAAETGSSPSAFTMLVFGVFFILGSLLSLIGGWQLYRPAKRKLKVE